METIPLEMDDIFDDNEIDDIVPSRLPDSDDLDLDGGLEPMRDSRDEQNEGGEDPITDNPELLDKLKSLKGASKNIAKRTIIKLDAARLTGERGIPLLPKIFNDVKLKGKNHEVDDLKTIMHHLEHWAHRLFPKMPFAEVLDRAERLGAKKEVQTCVKRIRLGMPVLATDVVDDEEDVQREGDRATAVSNQLPDEDDIPEDMVVINQPATPRQEEENRESEPSPIQNGSPSLSEEAKARIERNKKLAMERRAARLARADGTTNSAPSPGPSSLHATEAENSSESHLPATDAAGKLGDEHCNEQDSLHITGDKSENIVLSEPDDSTANEQSEAAVNKEDSRTLTEPVKVTEDDQFQGHEQEQSGDTIIMNEEDIIN